MGLNKQPEGLTLCNLEVVLMPNGEVIHQGQTLGRFDDLKKYLTIKCHRKTVTNKDK